MIEKTIELSEQPMVNVLDEEKVLEPITETLIEHPMVNVPGEDKVVEPITEKVVELTEQSIINDFG